MVFRWLFSSSSSSNPPPPEPEDPPYDEHALRPGDSTPAAVEDLSRPLQVPLSAIPPILIEEHPELKLSDYDLSRGQYARNVLALTHNAVRVEMSDMWSDIFPSLQKRCHSSAPLALSQQDLDDLHAWWSGFARFTLTSSLVDDMVTKKAFNDIYVGFDKETKQIDALFHKVQEKNNVYLELAFKKMATAVENFEKDPSENGCAQLLKAWRMLATMLGDIFAESERLIQAIDRWVRNPFEYKDLEKQATKIFTNKKRWGDDDSKRGEMIIMLCRWLNSEELMREWMFRNLTKKELRYIDKWMNDYRVGRLVIIDRLYQKKAATELGYHTELEAIP
ncbi:hypothetical protein BWQ96_01241 [Gracilariopsis chorda]|uniref:Uncharacterized protein n=1 Tax=Gracilariopsis chorda TaxID=448386 RepID=A0A2V3J3F0_9FLOR|nr:hypothetical protein BWQ96_01241 [Gracilariopsis chorda]|eukprot:PXF48899.1 hypothetical protein BWQ96_01241 [Gracilariopsis chorda]